MVPLFPHISQAYTYKYAIYKLNPKICRHLATILRMKKFPCLPNIANSEYFFPQKYDLYHLDGTFVIALIQS